MAILSGDVAAPFTREDDAPKQCGVDMLRAIWRAYLAEPSVRAIAARMEPGIRRIAREEANPTSGPGSELEQLKGRLAEAEAHISWLRQHAEHAKPWLHNLHVTPIDLHPKIDGPFMVHSTCSAQDFLRPRFTELCRHLALSPGYHRKLWEWVFILHHAERTGAVGPGKRALGFAVGREPLPSAFAAMGANVTATDAPAELGVKQGWLETGQHARQLSELHMPGVVDRGAFLERVSFEVCDMTAIGDALSDFDFCWSSCSFEHLGTIERGLEFVVESVERCLKRGGVAVHTTELNLSSDADTVEEGGTVLYRRSDLRRLIDRLEVRGHHVEPFSVAPDTHVLDFYADTAPYASPHLRLKLMGYVATSVGLVITRGGR